MTVTKNDELVKRIARLAKQNKELVLQDLNQNSGNDPDFPSENLL